ncbi:MAG: RHS repeat domain-containing protein [Candidatus Obscuribacterales bacterium]
MSDQASYQYTAQGWLKKVTFANGDTVEYFYDSMGNRTSVVVTIA